MKEVVMKSPREVEAEKMAQAMKAVAAGANRRRIEDAARWREADEKLRGETARIAQEKAAEVAAAEVACAAIAVAIREKVGARLRMQYRTQVAKRGEGFTATLSVPYVNFLGTEAQHYTVVGDDDETICTQLTQALTVRPPARSSPEWEARRVERFGGSPPHYFFGGSPRRTTHCAECKHPLDSSIHAECSSCGGIICPKCACCGCRISDWRHRPRWW